jgi:hypothetical protein
MARTRTQSIKVDPTRPLFAAVGTVDYAVHIARTAQTRLAQVDVKPRAIAGTVEAKVSETVDDLNKQYVDLAARGRSLVGRIRRQKSTQDLKAASSNTTSRAKATRTRAAKTADEANTSAKTATTAAKRSAKATGASAKSTKSSAKATGTSAKKTATAAKRATQDAAAKTGA